MSTLIKDGELIVCKEKKKYLQKNQKDKSQSSKQIVSFHASNSGQDELVFNFFSLLYLKVITLEISLCYVVTSEMCTA